MYYWGDFRQGQPVDIPFPSQGLDGASITLATDGTLRIYKNNSITQRTSLAGVTFTEDFDGTTGWHHIRIDTTNDTDPGFYAAGNDFTVGVVGAVVDGKTVNTPLGSWSIENRAALRATTAGETLDVTGGKVELLAPITEAGVATASAVAVWAAATRSLTEKTGFDLSSAGIVAIWSAAVRELSASGNTAVATALAGSFSSLTSALALIQADTTTIVSAIDPTGAADIDTIKAAVDTEVAAIKAKTDQLTFTTPNVVDSTGSGGASAAAVAAAVWAKVIDTQGSITAQQAMDIILAVVAGVTDNAGLTFKSPNGSATRLVATVNALNERLTITLTPSA